MGANRVQLMLQFPNPYLHLQPRSLNHKSCARHVQVRHPSPLHHSLEEGQREENKNTTWLNKARASRRKNFFNFAQARQLPPLSSWAAMKMLREATLEEHPPGITVRQLFSHRGFDGSCGTTSFWSTHCSTRALVMRKAKTTSNLLMIRLLFEEISASRPDWASSSNAGEVLTGWRSKSWSVFFVGREHSFGIFRRGGENMCSVDV